MAEYTTMSSTAPTYEQYAIDVASGKIVAGELVHLACKRFLDDLNRDDLEFRRDEVTRCIRFISIFTHYTGEHNGEHFVMEPWQEWCTANIVGFYWPNGRRRFTTSYIEVARKNGKSMWAAALAMYFFVADGEPAAEVLIVANSKEQARIAYDMCAILSEQLDPRGALLKTYRTDIRCAKTRSRLKPLASGDSKNDGYNCSFGICDEFHAAKTSVTRDVVRSSMGMRKRAHLCTITTAGFDKTLPCYQLRTAYVNVLRGNVEDDSSFVAIYCMDEGDDWHDENVWQKANPNIGVTVLPEYLHEQIQQATINPMDEVGVKTKNLNLWCDVAEVWMPDALVSKLMRKIDYDEFADRVTFCGVDLAAVSDLTAVAFLTRKDGMWLVKVEYFLPADSLLNGINAPLYREWHKQGYLHVTDGNVTDYDAVTRLLLQVQSESDLIGIAYDSWNSTSWASDATTRGLPLMQYSQAVSNFNKPTKELERLMLSEAVMFDYNPVTSFCFRNVKMKVDVNGNEKPTKEFKSKKIDGVIASIQALGCALTLPQVFD